MQQAISRLCSLVCRHVLLNLRAYQLVLVSPVWFYSFNVELQYPHCRVSMSSCNNHCLGYSYIKEYRASSPPITCVRIAEALRLLCGNQCRS